MLGGRTRSEDRLKRSAAVLERGTAKKSILDFVAKVTKEGGKDFVPVAERIATFDNDGTLWCEQPMSVQLAFALDRVKALAAKHPEWKEKQPFKAALEGDMKTVFAVRRTRADRTADGHPRRHDHGGV